MRTSRITALAGGLLTLVVVAGGLAATSPDTHAGEAAPTAEPASRTVTLVTGDQVHLTTVNGGHTVVSMDPPAGVRSAAGTPARARSMNVGGRTYVVPESAMPYVGRQLDLSLFDVIHPPESVEVAWAPSASPHPVPGLTLATTADGVSTGTVSEPARLGSALAATHGDPASAPLAGVRTIRAAGGQPVGEPTADPAYPQATLVVKGINALGAPARSGGVSVSNADDVLRFGSMRSFAAGEVAFSVPIGTYSLSVDIATWADDDTYVSDAVLVFPEIQVTSPQTVVTADARTADVLVPVPSTPRPARSDVVQLTYGRTSASGGSSTTTYLMMGGSPKVLVTPTKPVTIGELNWYTFFHLLSPADANPQYSYDLHLPSDGVVPDSFATSVSESSLASVQSSYHAEVAEHAINVHRASIEAWELMPFRATGSVVAPLRRIEYVSALPDVGWIGVVYWRPSENVGYLQGPLTVFRRGELASDEFLAAPLAPGTWPGSEETTPCLACRQGDVLALQVQPWTDPGGHALTGLAPTTSLQAGAEARLYVNDALHTLPSLPMGSTTVPAAEADFRLELRTLKSAPWTTTATDTSTVWTWRSKARTGTLPAELRCADGTQDCAVEPLLLVDYDAGVDLDNSVPAGAATPIDLGVYHQDGTAPGVSEISLEISTDDGDSWQPATVRARGAGRFSSSLVPPTGAKFISLRVRASATQGSTVDQTITRALRVAVH